MLSPVIGGFGAPSTSAANFGWIGAADGFATSLTTDAAAAVFVPQACTLSNLYVELTTAPGAGKNYVYAVMRNGSASSLTVTIADTATNAIDNDPTHAVTFAAGDTISLRATPSGTPTSSGAVRWNLVVDGQGQVLVARTGNNATTLSYLAMAGGSGSSTEAEEVVVMPTSGTFSNLYATISATPGGVATKIYTLRVNGANTAITCTIASASTTANDTTNSVAVKAGDRVAMQVDVTGVPTSSQARMGILFTPDIKGESLLVGPGSGSSNNPSTSATNYTFAQASAATWTATEANTKTTAGNWVIKGMAARTNTAAGAAKSYTFSLRKNGAATGLTAACANTTTAQIVPGAVSLANGDWISLEVVPAGTPTASIVQTAFLIGAAPTLLNNYQGVKVGDGMSTGEKIR